VLRKISAGFCRFRIFDSVTRFLQERPCRAAPARVLLSRITRQCPASRSAPWRVHPLARVSEPPRCPATPAPATPRSQSGTPPAGAGTVRVPPAPVARR